MLDDPFNLSAIPLWLNGELSLTALLFERAAGTFGRPLSMASFALNAWIGGYNPYSLKIGNLITHLLCGVTIFGFLRLLLRQDALLQSRASLYAAVVAALWMLHPLHASTVLYVVQRMAQLSTLFVLLGLWLYVASRQRLDLGPSLTASSALLIGVPALTGLAFLAKENGLLLPLLCAVVEGAYFRRERRPKSVQLFHWIYVALPGLVGILAFALAPQRILGGYINRDFTFVERLLSQPRAICDYLSKLLLPNPPSMGVYTDDFVVSTGILSPPTTLAAAAAILIITALAWRWRDRLPALLFGWLFFLAAHALESGVIALELYFEHRNYLPSVGIFTAATALAAATGKKLSGDAFRPRRVGLVLLSGTLLVLAFSTHGRARVWQSDLMIAESALISHPDSLRANAAVLSAAITRGDDGRANEILNSMITSENVRTKSLGHLYRLYMNCSLDHDGNPVDLTEFLKASPLPLTSAETKPFSYIYEATNGSGCGRVTDHMLAGALIHLTDRAKAQADSDQRKWKARYYAASFLARANDWEATLTQATLAWQSDADPPVAMPLILAQLYTGDVAGGRQTLLQLEARADLSNKAEQNHIRWLREQVEAAQAAFGEKSALASPSASERVIAK
ncbi:ArnT family glycosyltransferase [Luteimonas sp. A482]